MSFEISFRHKLCGTLTTLEALHTVVTQNVLAEVAVSVEAFAALRA